MVLSVIKLLRCGTLSHRPVTTLLLMVPLAPA